MPAFSLIFRLLALAGAFCAVAPAAQAQRAATRIDSLRAARNGKIEYFPAKFTFVSGKQVTGYVTDYAAFTLDRVECYEVPPDRIPAPSVKSISIERLKSMEVDGHTLVALYDGRKPMKMLAENVTPVGGAQTYGYSITKADMYIPIPLPVGGGRFIPVGSHDKYFWFVCPPGGEVQEVPRGGQAFAEVLGRAFAGCPALAARIRARQDGAGFKNMPELVSEYNAYFASLPPAPRLGDK